MSGKQKLESIERQKWDPQGKLSCLMADQIGSLLPIVLHDLREELWNELSRANMWRSQNSEILTQLDQLRARQEEMRKKQAMQKEASGSRLETEMENHRFEVTKLKELVLAVT